MKRTIIFILTLLAVSLAFAQTQNGVVKTRGKMVNGKLVPGTLLQGATVHVEGRQAVVAKDGKFSFPVKDGRYTLQSVSKQGYSLVDADACRQYNYSANPLQIVMEEPEQQQRDKLAAERRIRRQLQDQLREKEDEIEALREQNRLTDEQYRNQLQKLYSEQQSNEKLISEMAKQYSELDYDQLDEFQRQVSYCIENGQLSKADSLLRSRGNVAMQVKESLMEGAALKQQREQLQKAEKVHAIKIEEMAARCHSYYEMFLVKHQNDSAAHYLELRASLDTNNIQWQYEAGWFIEEYLADVDKALSYLQRALRHALTVNGGQNEYASQIYNIIAALYKTKGRFSAMMSYFQKSLSIRKSLYGDNSPKIAANYINIATANYIQGKYDLALQQYDTVFNLLKGHEAGSAGAIASVNGNVGNIYLYYKGDSEKALHYYEKQKELLLQMYGEKNPELIIAYDHLSEVLMGMGKVDEAMDYNKKARDVAVEFYGENHPAFAGLLLTLGKCYLYKGEPQKALEYLNKGYEIMQRVYGDNNQEVADLLVMTAYAYFSIGDFEKSLEIEQKVLEIHVKIFGENHRTTAYDYLFLANCYQGMSDFHNAMANAEKALEIYNNTLGPDHEETMTAKQTIEEIQKDKEKSGLRD